MRTITTQFLVNTRCHPGGWARADTIQEALKNLRRDWSKAVKEYGYVVWQVHPETYCEGVWGDLVYPRDHPPKHVQTVDGPKAKNAKPVR